MLRGLYPIFGKHPDFGKITLDQIRESPQLIIVNQIKLWISKFKAQTSMKIGAMGSSNYKANF